MIERSFMVGVVVVVIVDKRPRSGIRSARLEPVARVQRPDKLPSVRAEILRKLAMMGGSRRIRRTGVSRVGYRAGATRRCEIPIDECCAE